ncbi:Cytochrome P450 2A9 [Halotydeus destructor]|nr:Cytochrome P450 2A9 [Halotydeus destructor]
MMGQSALSQNCDIFLDVTEDLVDFIKSRHGRPTDYHEALSKTTTNAITCVLYSKRYDWDDHEMSFITTNIRYLFHKLRGLEILYAGPIFKWYMKIMHRGRHHAILKASEACIALFERMAERRFQNFDFEKKRDFFDHFLANHVKEIDDGIPEKDHLFTIKSLASTTFSLIVGAADSSAETMYWALYFLAKNLVVQKKVQQELDDVIGLRVITMADRSRLPYMMAFMEETQRMACLSPMTSTREVVSNTAICGIKVPKGSYVIPNIYACLSDETYFKEPEVFDPTRFLDDNGKFVTIEANCQFTLGKRNCAGETFARVEMFTILATIVQSFNITFPSEGYDVAHTESPLRALSPHELCINERYRAS